MSKHIRKNFTIHKDLTNITDSMLLESGTVVAEYHNEEEDIHLSLEVVGNVALTFKGKYYYEASEFPKELKDMIQENRYADESTGDKRKLFSPWWHHPDLEVRAYNWLNTFELVERKNGFEKTGRGWCEDSRQFGGYTKEDILDIFLDREREILEERGIER